MKNKMVLTGVKPTGMPHLGNYVGAIKPAIELARDAHKAAMFVADYHALNQIHDPAALQESSDIIAATFLALGLNPDQTIFFRQSDVPETFELSTILATVTPKGLMNRSHAYKAVLDNNRAAGKSEEDLDAGVNMGLYTYPILMAADILLYETDLVPVGKDQIQHIEFTRDIADYFNRTYGETLKLPEYFVPEDAAAIPGLDGRKMSKSYHNIIPLFEESKKLRKLIMKIVTDSLAPADPKDPDNSTIFQLYTQFATADDVETMRKAFLAGGMGYGEAKTLLFEAADAALAEPREKFNELMGDTSRINKILIEGSERARDIAGPVLARTKEAAGIRRFHSS